MSSGGDVRSCIKWKVQVICNFVSYIPPLVKHHAVTAQHDGSVITGGLQTSLYLSKKENCIQTQESEAERERDA